MARKPRPWPDTPAPLAAPVVDNHTHLPVHPDQIPRREGVRLPLDEQLQRAREVNISRLITVGCEMPDWQPTLALARQYPGVRVALAIHPNEAPLHTGFTAPSPDGLQPRLEPHHKTSLDDALGQLDQLLSDRAVVAVGETGIDRFRTAPEGIAAQRQAFAAHLELARQHDLPVQIHDRDAHADCVEVIEQNRTGDDPPIVFHCFSGGVELAQKCAQNGWYASFSGTVTIPSNQYLRDALQALPRELVLVETDAPYLTPAPWRGCPNATYVMAHTVRFLAYLWGCSEHQACEQLTANTDHVYGSWDSAAALSQ